MINPDVTTITKSVIERQANCRNDRLALVMESLIKHLHAFASEVNLTEREWETGIQFLTECGDITDEKRQEFILLSDTLGLSMLVIALNHIRPPACTESTVFGPFYTANAPQYKYGDDITNGAPGVPAVVSGVIRSENGKPVSNAEIHVWQADEDGLYDVQYASNYVQRGRGIIHSQDDGLYCFKSVVPEDYPIPHDGPVGKMLVALGRHPWRPAHLHFMIKAPGFKTLITHVFRRDSKYLYSDAVFGVRTSLIADWVRHESGQSINGDIFLMPFYTLNFDFVLSPN